MDKTEIVKYLGLGDAQSLCVHRCLLERYPGFVREITIMKNNIIKTEFNVYECDEGELRVKAYYNDLDELISELEKYIGENIERWGNITLSGWYPELNVDVDFNQSGLKLKHDLVNRTLKLPQNAIKYEIPEGYWKSLFDGKIEI